MSHVASISRGPRVAALAAVVVVHLLFLILFLSGKTAVRPFPAKARAMTVMSLARDPNPTPPTPPKLPSQFVHRVPIAPQPAVAETLPSTTGAADADACPTLETLKKALVADRAAVNEILAAPPETRSIADAIIVWNAGWSNATTAVVAPLAEVRATVLQSLAETDDRCLDEPIAGPRLVPIPAGEGTTFLVFGSGTWRWRQLLTDPEANPTSPPNEARVNAQSGA